MVSQMLLKGGKGGGEGGEANSLKPLPESTSVSTKKRKNSAWNDLLTSLIPRAKFLVIDN